MINTATLSLTLGTDPEHRQAGDKVITSARAFMGQGKEQDGSYRPSLWFELTAWPGWSADDLFACKKGDRVTVTGRLSMREYNEKQYYGLTVQGIDGAPRQAQPPARNVPQKQNHGFADDEVIPF